MGMYQHLLLICNILNRIKYYYEVRIQMGKNKKYQGYIKLGAFKKQKRSRRRVTAKKKGGVSKKTLRKSSSNSSTIYKLAFILLLLVLFVKLGYQGVSLLDQYKNLSFTDPLGAYLLDPHDINPDNGVVTVTAIIIEAPLDDRTEISGDNSVDKIDTSKIQHIYFNIWNSDLEKGILICIPGWVYYPSLLSQITDGGNYVSFANSLYVAEKTDDIAYVLGDFETTFGIPINSYIWVDRYARQFTDDVFGKVVYVDDSSEYMENFINSLSLLDLMTSSKELNASVNGGLDSIENGDIDARNEAEIGIHTNLSPVEMYNIVKRIDNHMGNEAMAVIDLSEEDAYRNGALESGYPVKLLNVNTFDSLLEGRFQVLRSRAVEKEQAKVEVFNSSDIGGLASTIGRYITNNGLTLLRAGNSPVDIDTTTIFVTDPVKYEHSVNLIKAYVGRVLYWSSLTNGVGDDLDGLGGSGRGVDRNGDGVVNSQDIEIRVVTGRPSFLTTGDVVVVVH